MTFKILIKFRNIHLSSPIEINLTDNLSIFNFYNVFLDIFKYFLCAHVVHRFSSQRGDSSPRYPHVRTQGICISLIANPTILGRTNRRHRSMAASKSTAGIGLCHLCEQGRHSRMQDIGPGFETWDDATTWAFSCRSDTRCGTHRYRRGG